MGEHSLLSPSSAHRWAVCTASVARCKGLPEKTSEYAEEGTEAHAWAKKCLDEGISVFVYDQDKEMETGVNTYISTVRAMTQGAISVWVEEPLDLSDVVGVKDEKGTADYIALMPNELQVHDLKYGKGVMVDAEGNLQLIEYGLGALEVASLISDDIKQIRLVIHQPRKSHVSEVVYTIEELYKFRDQLRKQAQIAISGKGEFVPGEKQCRWCLAKGECEELRDFCIGSVVDDFDDISDFQALKDDVQSSIAKVKLSDAQKIAAVLNVRDLIADWLKAVENYAFEQLLSGKEIPGYKLVEGRAGNRRWIDNKAAEETMKSMRLKVDQMYEFSLISPTTAETLLKKSSPRKWGRLKDQITQSDPKPAIVPMYDKRPALQIDNPLNDFEDICDLV